MYRSKILKDHQDSLTLVHRDTMLRYDETNIVSGSNKSLTDQLLDLSKLFEDGLLTEEEFTKAKKKLFN